MSESQNNQTFDPNPAAATGDEQSQATFALQRIYNKDISFEAPNTPQIFQEQGQLEMKLNLGQRVESLGEDLFEVILTVTVTGTVNEKTAYLCEIQQAGIFQIAGMTEAQQNGVLNVYCPNTLFPYARSAVSQLVAAAGFPPVMLQPISFEQVYAQRLKEAQQGETANGSGEA